MSRRAFVATVMALAYPLRHLRSGEPGLEQQPLYSVCDYGARGDGVADDTRAIQRALDAATRAAPATVLFPPPSRAYRLTRELRLVRARGVVLTADGSTKAVLEQTRSRAMMLRLDECVDCRVSSLHLRGIGRRDPALDSPTIYAPALLVNQSRHVTVDRCLVESAVSNGIEGFNSSDCLITENECRDTALYNGIGWAGGDGTRIERNVLHGNRGQGIECRSLTRFVVRGNHCYRNGDPAFNQSAGITVEAENGQLTVVEATNTAPVRIRTDRPHLGKTGDRLTIRDIVGNDGANGTFEITVLDSTQFLLNGSSGQGKQQGQGRVIVPVDQRLATESRDGVVEGNICEYNRGYGIYVVASNNARVTGIAVRGNTVTGNLLDGIACATGVATQRYRDCRAIRIEDCVIGGNRRGIFLYFCADVVLRHNVVRRNRLAGIDSQATTITEYVNNCLNDNNPNVQGIDASTNTTKGC